MMVRKLSTQAGGIRTSNHETLLQRYQKRRGAWQLACFILRNFPITEGEPMPPP